MSTESNSAQSVPEGYHVVTPWIVVKGAARLIDYLQEAFDAEELGRVYDPDGTIGHAEVRIGDSVVMMFDAKEAWPNTPGFFRLYVEDGEAAYQRALAAGGTPVTRMTALFFGDQVGRVRDPFGNIWWIQSRVENVDPEQMASRAEEPAYRDAMQYLRSSLDEEMMGRAHK
jgi:PhnB protein